MTTSRSSGSEPSLRDRALRLLARSEKTRLELVKSLERHAPRGECHAVVDDLSRAGLQSDERAALSRARMGAERGWGRDRVLAELVARGVDEVTAAHAVSQALGQRDEEATLREQAAALLKSAGTDRELLRAARKLVGKGFDPEDVRRVLGLDRRD